MIIDAWAQHPTPRHETDPVFASLRRWLKSASPPAGRDAPAQRPVSWTLAAMDQAGVDVSLISAWYGPGGPMIANDDVASFVDESGGRLLGVGSVDIRRPMAAVAEIRRCVNDLGFKAIRILPWLWDRPPTDALFYPVYTACCDLGVPLCTQVGHTGPLMPSEPGRPIPYIDPVALHFPDLVIVGGHIGYPWTEEMIAVCTKHPNVYIDTSAYTVGRYPPALVAYLKTHGSTKVLFGSNWPMIPPARALDGLDALGLDEATRHRFLGENAARVFGIPPNEPGPTRS